MLEIIRPMGEDRQHTRQALLAGYAVVFVGAVALLLLCRLVLRLGRRRGGG